MSRPTLIGANVVAGVRVDVCRLGGSLAAPAAGMRVAARSRPPEPPGAPGQHGALRAAFAVSALRRRLPLAQRPAAGVIPYDLNSALFSDYAEKFRFIKLPPGTHATYSPDQVFEFPVGTVIAKTFAFPRDARDPSQGRRLIETRILKREPDGWVGLALRLEQRANRGHRSTSPAIRST